MSGSDDRGDDGASDDTEPRPGPGPGNERPTGPGPLVVAGALAAVVGWSIRGLSIRLDFAEPVVTWWSVAVVWVIGLAVAGLAYRTWRALQRRRPGDAPIEGYQAVNRLVVAKAAALAGALVAGGYAGFAIAHLGIPATELSGQRLLRSAIAALGGAGILVAGLLLERACRVPEDRD